MKLKHLILLSLVVTGCGRELKTPVYVYPTPDGLPAITEPYNSPSTVDITLKYGSGCAVTRTFAAADVATIWDRYRPANLASVGAPGTIEYELVISSGVPQDAVSPPGCGWNPPEAL